MNSRHQKTLEAIFAVPTRANIEFSAVEKLFVALGGVLIEGRGSRVRFHRPHPQKEAKPYQIEAAREFLERMGFKP